MAGDLIKDPRTPQTEVHDLESFYWVLLWICLSYMKTNKDHGARSSIINGTMSPRVYEDTGGDSKINYLTRPAALKGLEVYGKFLVAALLKSLHMTIGARYREELPNSELLSPMTSHAPDASQRTKLPTHESLLELLEKALKSQLWVEADDGPAESQKISLSNIESHHSSRSKRTHSTASRSGGFSALPPPKRSEVA